MFGGGFNNKKLSTQVNTDESGLILVQSCKPQEQPIALEKQRVKLTMTETNLDSESKHTDLMASKEYEYPDRKV